MSGLRKPKSPVSLLRDTDSLTTDDELQEGLRLNPSFPYPVISFPYTVVKLPSEIPSVSELKELDR